MINQITLVGRIVRTPELELTENGKKIGRLTLAVPREYKNINGEYDTDFIDCTLWTGVAESANEYCKSGDILGVRGKVQSRIIEKEDGTKYKKMEVVADRISFLASSKNGKEISNTETTLENTEDNIKEDNSKDIDEMVKERNERGEKSDKPGKKKR